LIQGDEAVHDPFAGDGLRLGQLCDERGCTFTGTDIESWRPRDSRVIVADSVFDSTYPPKPFTVITSPVYLNKRCADYPNGPTP
jgi:hypothetical protein